MAVKVLIVEDNPVARSFLCRVVRESFSDDLAIVEAGNLETARRHVSLTWPSLSDAPVDPFKLALVDLELPDGNGMELLAELAGYPATKIVTTLYSDDDHLFPALQCGADGYLLKEDRFEVLVEELQKIVRGQPPLSPAIARRLLNHFRLGNTSGAEAPSPPTPSGFVSSRPIPLARSNAPNDHERFPIIGQAFPHITEEGFVATLEVFITFSAKPDRHRVVLCDVELVEPLQGKFTRPAASGLRFWFCLVRLLWLRVFRYNHVQDSPNFECVHSCRSAISTAACAAS